MYSAKLKASSDTKMQFFPAAAVAIRSRRPEASSRNDRESQKNTHRASSSDSEGDRSSRNPLPR